MSNTASATNAIDQLFAQTRSLIQSGSEASPLLLQFADIYLANLSHADAVYFSAAGLTAAIRTLWTVGNNAPTAAMPRISATVTGMLSNEAPASSFCVVQPDRPFLIDSLTNLLQKQGIELRCNTHPLLEVTRDTNGKILNIATATALATPTKESWAQFFFGAATSDSFAALEAEAALVLTDVAAAVDDWQAMSRRLQEAQVPLAQNTADPEPAAFLAWLDAGHFTYLGIRDYIVQLRDGAYSLQLIEDSGLGIVRSKMRGLFSGLPNAPLAPDIQRFLTDQQPLLVSKTRQVSTVHRAVPMDAIFIKLKDENGKLTGVRLVAGLLTSLAYSRNARDIPLVRQKVTAVLTRSGLAANSHNGKALRHVLDTYPRDELFQTPESDLYDIALGIMQLRDRRRVALFMRRDPFDRFASCLIYVPREAYDTNVRRRILTELEMAFKGSVERYDLALDENPLVRLHVIVNLPEGYPQIDLGALESRLVDICRTWSDQLRDALTNSYGEARGLNLYARYENAFNVLYRDSVTPDATLQDIAMLESMTVGKLPFAVKLLDSGTHLSFRVYTHNQPLDLSETLPTLANLGFHIEGEYGPYPITINSENQIWLHDYRAAKTEQTACAITAAAAIEAAFSAVRERYIEDDRFNRLTLIAGLPWREIGVLRALAKYLRQIELPFNVGHIADILAHNPEAARLLTQIFITKFDPDLSGDRAALLDTIKQQLTDYIRQVPNLDDDRILSAYAELLDAALRTNYFQLDARGEPKTYLSIKFNSRAIAAMPLPKPFAEIWVYSPRVEAVHLRGGKVARGGIRWSDRRDFRTEVLGLMKAQVVKNTVIVPTGSKGGFRLKSLATLPDNRAAGISGYTEMMHGLLDITDNYHGTDVTPPPRVVRHDGDDPYLVVAADKGTATFSDIANGVSAEYNFWLGDAFASGGSAGYDHKHMGITARGAWESVKRHFRELGVDTQTHDFTVIGVGDMAGDVFGNGMLLSPHIKLVAAFNYAHIFIDPTPDTVASFAERQRLFDLGRGSWDLYNTALISKGGGVWPRSQKSIPLSPEAQQLLGVNESAMNPEVLMRAILAAQADLLYFGGIGTYIRAPEETDTQVGDKANDAIRLDATLINVRVIGEGANLGITQRGRIALANRGVKLNTDAVDNSAGVDTSDHEVNIKILAADLINHNQLTVTDRNTLLKTMTDDVAGLVLRDNYLQTQALTLVEARAADLLPAHRAFMTRLEAAGSLNRAVEFLPDEAELARRETAKQGLTRPELAVLMAYSKIWLDQQLVQAPLTAEAVLEPELFNYFPSALAAQTDAIKRHRLSREIATTVLVNELVNRLGPTGIATLMNDTGAGAETIARAYLVIRDAFAFPVLWEAIEALDNKTPAKSQTLMQLTALRALEQAITALLMRPTTESKLDIIAERQLQIDARTELMHWLQTASIREGDNELLAFTIPGGSSPESRLPDTLAAHLRLLHWLPLLPRLSFIARETTRTLAQIIPVFVSIDERLQLRRLGRQLQQIAADTPFQAQALRLLAGDMLQIEQKLTTSLVTAATQDLSQWLAARGRNLSHYDALVASARATPVPDFALWSLIGRALLQLAD